MCKYLVAAAIALLLVVLSASAASAQIDPANSVATLSAPAQIMVCPGADGTTLISVGVVIIVQVVDVTGLPVAALTWNDFEVDGIPPAPLADGFVWPNTWNTPAAGFANLGNGAYQLAGTFVAGGYAPQAFVKVQGMTLGSPALALMLNSPDRTGDGVVNLSDVGFLAQVLGGAYDWRLDFNADGVINLSDAGFMSLHLGCAYPMGYLVDPVD